jgi:hypothetical protein
MSTRILPPWTNFVKLHPDVEAGALTEDIFAVSLGAIAERDMNAPVVSRDPEAFFRATHLTKDITKLLDEVLSSLSGKPGFNRVLKLRTPFGGGKSHTLAALYHAAKSRQCLDEIPEAANFPKPGEVDVAVFDGEKFDARNGKKVDKGRIIQTIWGWLAYQFGEEKFKLVEGHDQDRVAPGGDVIKEILAGKPKLFLIDELLKYIERASAVTVQDSTLRRQALDFIQNLTVEVAGSKNSVLVYSLQWSKREAMDNIALLEALDKITGRVDQLREPVSGDEVLPVLQRRLLAEKPSASVAKDVADAYSDIVTNSRRASAENESDRRMAEELGIELRERIKGAYPFHPTLIDIMKERWSSMDAFQRTRGALRFLALCLHTLKAQDRAGQLIGPGDIPLNALEVRNQLFKELGVQNEYDAVISSDIVGPNGKAKRIDDRLARETPALASVKPATRIATTIFAYSFGGLRRQGSKDDDILPPGVNENELLTACLGPDLDNITATAVLAELRNSCLFLHYDGVRYCFKKDPNVTKLIEDAEQEVARNHEDIKRRIFEMLNQRLAGQRGAIIWPAKTQDMPDCEPRFLLGYLSLEFTALTKPDQNKEAIDFLSKFGEKPRQYRNGVGLAIPDKKQVEPIRRAVRYLMAIQRVEDKKRQLRLSKDQEDQLRERRRTEEAAAEHALRNLYNAVWLLRMENGGVGIEPVEIGGRPLQATEIHNRMMELLTSTGTPKVYLTVKARKVMERVKLGEPLSEGGQILSGVKVSDIVDAFYSFLQPPRLIKAEAIKTGIATGIREGFYAYTSGHVPTQGQDGKYQINLDKLVINRFISDDEIDLESGFLIIPSAVPQPEPNPSEAVQAGPLGPATIGGASETPGATIKPPAAGPIADKPKVVQRKFKATRDQVFKAFQAIANLADKSDGSQVTIHVEGFSENGYDPSWLRNAFDEPLNEADIEEIN